MSLPFILDIAIGLLFFYLIISLLASEIQELLTTLLQWRAAHLRKSIENLLIGGKDTQNDETVKEIVRELYENPLIRNISQESKEGIEAVLRKIVRAIVTFGRNKKLTLTEGNEPSYIPSETFATTLLERLKLPQLVNKVTALNLQKFVENEIHSQIKVYIEDKTLQISNDTWKTLRADFSSLETINKEIYTNFTAGKATLMTSVNRLRDELNFYIDLSTSYLESAASSEQTGASLNEQQNASIKRLVEQLKLLKKSTFYQDESYNNTNEVLQRLQLNLNQILALIDIEVDKRTNQITEMSETFSSFQKEFEVVGIANAYLAVEDDIKAIALRLPLSVKKSFAALAERTQINLTRVQTQVRVIEDELRRFQVEIEAWFDRSMERASGVYKRNAKGVAFLIGFLLAWAANADTFHIVNRLAADSNLRNVLAENAEVVTTNCPSSAASGRTASQLECIHSQISY